MGKLIVFEGPDGVGKSELSRRCVERLRREGVCCDHIAFPGREEGTLGKLVYQVHHAPEDYAVSGMSAASLQILHVAAHVDAIENRILPALRAGRTVVMDRFWWSTFVYGKVAGASAPMLRAMIELECAVWAGIRPRNVFLIQRPRPLRDEPPAQWAACATEYVALAEKESSKYPVTKVANTAGVDDACDCIAEVLAGVFPSKPLARRTREGKVTRPVAAEAVSTGVPLAVFSKSPSPKPTAVYDTYWRFAAERQNIFHKRAAGQPQPWTKDLILSEHKFTNAYRASDRVSQYLIRDIIYKGDQSPEEVFFRTILFKLFNRIGTWEMLQWALGEVRYAHYRFSDYDALLSRAIDHGTRIYSAAYIMPSGGSVFGLSRKHRTHLKLVEWMMRDELPLRLAESRTMGEAFERLRSYPTIGDFLAYQYVTDLNYSNLINFSEMDFVVPGPGARDGIRKCFSDLGGLTESDIIRLVADRQQSEFERLGLQFHDLWSRPLQLIDCQNLFCEVDKYARVKHPEFQGLTGRTRIKQKFQPTDHPILYWYPPKWHINECIKQGRGHDTGLLWS